MNIEKIFKNIILIDIFLLILVFISVFFIPEDIEYISDNLGFGYLSILSETNVILVFLVFIIAYVINLFLLYRFVRIGKNLYLFLFIISIVLSLLSGPEVLTSFQLTLDYLSGATSGAILVLLYFSPIKDKF